MVASMVASMVTLMFASMVAALDDTSCCSGDAFSRYDKCSVDRLQRRCFDADLMVAALDDTRCCSGDAFSRYVGCSIKKGGCSGDVATLIRCWQHWMIQVVQMNQQVIDT